MGSGQEVHADKQIDDYAGALWCTGGHMSEATMQGSLNSSLDKLRLTAFCLAISRNNKLTGLVDITRLGFDNDNHSKLVFKYVAKWPVRARAWYENTRSPISRAGSKFRYRPSACNCFTDSLPRTGLWT